MKITLSSSKLCFVNCNHEVTLLLVIGIVGHFAGVGWGLTASLAVTLPRYDLYGVLRYARLPANGRRPIARFLDTEGLK